MKKIVLIYTLCFFCQNLIAGDHLTQPVRTIIAGRITNGRSDTMSLYFFTRRMGITTVGAKIEKNITANGEFKLVIPEFTGIAYISLFSSVWPRLALVNYLVEPGDSIYLTADPSGLSPRVNIMGVGLHFTGRNSEKYQARYEIDSLYRKDILKNMADGPPPPRNPEPRFDTLCMEMDINHQPLTRMKLAILEANKTKISPLSYHIMKTDIIYQNLIAILNQYSLSWGPVGKYSDSLERLKIMVNYFHDRLENEPELMQTIKEGRSYSWAYLDFITRRTMNLPRISKGRGVIIRASDYIPFINQLPADMQEKTYTAIAAYLYTYTPNVLDVNLYLDSVLKKVSDPFLSGILFNYQSRMQKGSSVFPFRLPDSNGKMVSTEAFIGKTVLVDFWFTGCLACIKLAGKMRLVKEILKNDKNIVFVSISADKEKETWLNSLNQGKYTDMENINLYTDGLGFNHPLLNHYNFTAFPRMIVIDPAGRIYDTNPPMPDGEGTIIALATMLKEAGIHR